MHKKYQPTVIIYGSFTLFFYIQLTIYTNIKTNDYTNKYKNKRTLRPLRTSSLNNFASLITRLGKMAKKFPKSIALAKPKTERPNTK